MPIDSKTLKQISEYSKLINLISIEYDIPFDYKNFAHITNPLLYDCKLAENNSDFEQILIREMNQYCNEFRVTTTPDEYRFKLIYKLESKIKFVKDNSSGDEDGISSAVMKAELFINYLQKRIENFTPEALEKVRKILPALNEHIFENATIQDFANMSRETPPQEEDRIKVRKIEAMGLEATADLLHELFDKFNFYKIVTVDDKNVWEYVNIKEGAIRNAKSKFDSERTREKKREIFNEVFKAIQ